MKIDPKRTYSARELIAVGGIGKDLKTIARRIMEDKLRTRPILNAEIRGEGKMRRYYVQGANVLKYLKTIAK